MLHGYETGVFFFYQQLWRKEAETNLEIERKRDEGIPYPPGQQDHQVSFVLDIRQ